MNRLTLKAATALLVLAAAAHAEDDPWITNDWPAAQKRARRLDRPIFVVFRCQH